MTAMDIECEHKCFYCDRDIFHRKGQDARTADGKSKDHYYPKNHPNYDATNIVLACFQCNETKGCGEPEEFIEALKIDPLPVWGEHRATRRWCKRMGYNPMKHSWKCS